MTYTIDEIRKKDLIIFEAIMGSHAYGTATPESDKDIRGVFIQPLDHILRYGFVEQVSDEKNDVTFYELGRFINLLMGNNPNILEMLAVPKDCIIYRHDMFKKIESHKADFLTKRVRWTFAGYAIDQIQKARGYNKKMNWEENQMTRKTVLDFCYVLIDGGSVPFKSWAGYDQKYYGLAAVDHAHDVYALYFLGADANAGLVSNEETANQVQLISIPKHTELSAYLTFNKDGYSSHCKKYAEYQTWLKERNVNRFRMNKEHGKQYDSKNMMHTYRLLLMAHELLRGELRVRRNPEEIDKLMKIRRGEYEYDDILREAEAMISNLDVAVEKSTLPKDVDRKMAYDLLYDIREYIYM
jgi:predicted nucleotidyltransferase